jgi:RNA polymerase sigma-70 factor, ECF subfamily
MDIARLEGSRDVLVTHNESSWNDARFDELFLQHYSRVVRVLYRLLGDRPRAEELANDVFWKLYRQTWLRTSDGKVGGWLHRTAINLGIDHLRSVGRRQEHEQQAAYLAVDHNTVADPLVQVLQVERARRVRSVLAKLKPAHAQILVLRASGLTYKELADSLGFKLGTIGTMLVRAEAAFQKQFRRMYGNEEAL